MSQLEQLKQTVSSLSESANRTAGSLAQFNSQFTDQVSSVQAAIGGSAQGKDREVCQAIQQAAEEVKKAAQALQNAGRIAQQYATSL